MSRQIYVSACLKDKFYVTAYCDIDGNGHSTGFMQAQEGEESRTRVLKLGLENVIASNAPNYYGKWIDESYKDFIKASDGSEMEVNVTAVDRGEDQDDYEVTMSIISCTGNVPNGQFIKTRGFTTYAMLLRTAAAYSNNMAIISYKDAEAGIFDIVYNGGHKNDDNLDGVVDFVLANASLIFIDHDIEEKHHHTISDRIHGWTEKNSSKHMPIIITI